MAHSNTINLLVTTSTKQLTQSLDAYSAALDELVAALRDFNDWLDEETVRLEGEK